MYQPTFSQVEISNYVELFQFYFMFVSRIFLVFSQVHNSNDASFILCSLLEWCQFFCHVHISNDFQISVKFTTCMMPVFFHLQFSNDASFLTQDAEIIFLADLSSNASIFWNVCLIGKEANGTSPRSVRFFWNSPVKTTGCADQWLSSKSREKRREDLVNGGLCWYWLLKQVIIWYRILSLRLLFSAKY